jgi:outer membrane receptor protein involved in Fe transport
VTPFRILLAFLALFALALPAQSRPVATSLIGTVTDEAGRPLPGAYVGLPALERVATTDTAGTYLLRGLPRGEVTVVIRSLGRQPATVRLSLRAGENRHDAVLSAATVTLVPVVVTGAATVSDPTTPLDVAAIDADRLRQTASASLGKTLEKLPGVATITTGPAAGNPVLRGMSQGQVRLTRDGLPIESFQGTSRWTPPISFGSVDRIEVIRGPASVLYGSSAMGGAINFLPKALPRAERASPTAAGYLESQYFSNNGERYLAGELSGAVPAGVGLRVGVSRREAGNFATADARPYAETGVRGDPRFTGVLPYTNYEQFAGFGQVGIAGARGQVQLLYDGYAGYNNFLNANGRPAGVRMTNHEWRARATALAGRWVLRPSVALQDLRIQRAATAQLTYEDARERDGWDQDLTRAVGTSRLEAEHGNIAGVAGKLGLEAQRLIGTTLRSAIEPSSRTANVAAFAFEEWRRGPLTVSAGARYDHRTQRAAAGTLVDAAPLAERPSLLNRTFSVANGSLGAGVRVHPAVTWLVNASTGFRAPSAQDLYTNENRPAFGWLEGNPRLAPERSVSLESGLRFQGNRATGQVIAYRNRVRDYIYMVGTGRTRQVRNEARLVYAHAQDDALIRGLEASAEGEILPRLTIETNYLMLRSLNRSTGEALPLMPADQWRASVRYAPRDRPAFRNTQLRVGARHAWAKAIAGPTEPYAEFDTNPAGYGISSTPAYHVVDASVSMRLLLGPQTLDLSVEVQNLADTPYRDFLDTQKGFALAQGRNISIRVGAPLRLTRQ